jgi:hypothetical protein
MDFPKTCTDTKGRSWTIDIGWGTFRRIKDKCGIDLDALVPRKDMTEEEQRATVQKYLDLIYSSTDFPPVLLCILDSQIKAAGITAEDFLDGFESSESIEAVTNAFRQGLSDFIRDPLQKLIFQKTMLGVERAQKMATKRIDAETERILKKMETDLNERIDLALKSTSTDSPASSESIPIPSA